MSYGQSCEIDRSTLYHSCFDLFALAHFLGWFFKTLICRDLKLIFFASVSFELIEYQPAQRAQQFQGVLVGPYCNRYFWLQFARHHLWVLGHRPIWARPLPLEPALGSSPLLALAEFQMLLEELGFEKARDQDLYHSAAIRQNGPLHRYGTFGLS